MKKWTMEGRQAISSQPLCITYPDGTEKPNCMQIVCSRGGSPYAKIYWHEDANQAVIATANDACMRYDTAMHALAILPMFDLMLMLCESRLKHPSDELIANCPSMRV